MPIETYINKAYKKNISKEKMKFLVVLLLVILNVCSPLIMAQRWNRRSSGEGRAAFGRTYTDIAKIVNPDQYVFIKEIPYPGQPFYPGV